MSRSGTRTAVISPNRSSRARCAASRASVLTRSPAGRCSFDGAATTHSIPASLIALANPEAGRTRLEANPHRGSQLTQPAQHLVMSRTQPRPRDLAGFLVDGMRHDRKRMHVQPNTRTLNNHRRPPDLQMWLCQRECSPTPVTHESFCSARPSASASPHTVYMCRDATKIDKTRLATLTKLLRVARGLLIFAAKTPAQATSDGTGPARLNHQLRSRHALCGFLLRPPRGIWAKRCHSRWRCCRPLWRVGNCELRGSWQSRETVPGTLVALGRRAVPVPGDASRAPKSFSRQSDTCAHSYALVHGLSSTALPATLATRRLRAKSCCQSTVVGNCSRMSFAGIRNAAAN